MHLEGKIKYINTEPSSSPGSLIIKIQASKRPNFLFLTSPQCHLSVLHSAETLAAYRTKFVVSIIRFPTSIWSFQVAQSESHRNLTRTSSRARDHHATAPTCPNPNAIRFHSLGGSAAQQDLRLAIHNTQALRCPTGSHVCLVALGVRPIVRRCDMGM